MKHGGANRHSCEAWDGGKPPFISRRSQTLSLLSLLLLLLLLLSLSLLPSEPEPALDSWALALARAFASQSAFGWALALGGARLLALGLGEGFGTENWRGPAFPFFGRDSEAAAAKLMSDASPLSPGGAALLEEAAAPELATALNSSWREINIQRTPEPLFAQQT